MPKKKERHRNSLEKEIRQFLDKEECKRADAYEQKLNADESLKNIEASPEMFEDIMRRVAAIETEKEKAVEETDDGEYVYVSQKDREAMELGRKVLERRKYRKVWRGLGIAAILLVVMIGVGVSSEAGRFRIANFWSLLVGKETVIKVDNNQDEEDIIEQDYAESEAWREIEEKTGIVPVKFMYLPEEMRFERYQVDETYGIAYLFYKYEDTIMNVVMTRGENSNKTSKSELHYDGATVNEIPVNTRYGEYTIVETKTDVGNNYMVSFEKDNCSYSIFGVSTRVEFKNMIENIFF